jgi:hypothetical protein
LPVKKLYLFSLTIVICLLFVSLPLMQAKTCYPSETTITRVAEKDSAIQAMLDGFKLYNSYFNAIEFKQGYYLPLHGRTRAEAIDYLGQVFEKNLATAIVDQYTCFIPALHCLAVKPGDGLPLLNHDDIPYLSCQVISDKHIIFSREFTGCYSPGDRYRYQVEMQLYQDHWKISALNLDEL